MSIEDDKAEYLDKVSLELDACFKDTLVLMPSGYKIKLSETGGLSLIRHLEKHGFEIIRKQQ